MIQSLCPGFESVVQIEELYIEQIIKTEAMPWIRDFEEVKNQHLWWCFISVSLSVIPRWMILQGNWNVTAMICGITIRDSVTVLFRSSQSLDIAVWKNRATKMWTSKDHKLQSQGIEKTWKGTTWQQFGTKSQTVFAECWFDNKHYCSEHDMWKHVSSFDNR